MLSKMIRSRTARCFGALIGAVALAAALPATASADRDGRGWRNERYDDHGWRGHRDYRWRADRWAPPVRYRNYYTVHRHGPSCAHRPVYRYGYYPYAAFYRSGWYFGR